MADGCPRWQRGGDEKAKILADGFGVMVEVLKALGKPEAPGWPSFCSRVLFLGMVVPHSVSETCFAALRASDR